MSTGVGAVGGGGAASAAARATPPAAAATPNNNDHDDHDADADISPRVLSIQSHVVSGYVGNKCATLPLQLLGFDVDPVMSVQLSNHTGYPSFKGKAFDGAHLEELLEGLKANGLVRHTHLLTGYIGTRSLLEAVVGAARALREANPSLTYGAARDAARCGGRCLFVCRLGSFFLFCICCGPKSYAPFRNLISSQLIFDSSSTH